MGCILITGGTGLVGANTAMKFAREGWNVVAYDLFPRSLDMLENFGDKIKVVRGDITDLPFLKKVVKKNKVEGIIHTAAIVGEGFYRNGEPVTGFMVNVGGTLNVLEAARTEKLRKVIFTSTAGVYGPLFDFNRPVKETDALSLIKALYADHYSTQPHYATTKMIAEQLVHWYHKVYRLDAVIIRLTMAWGPPGEYGTRRFNKFNPGVLSKILKGDEVNDNSLGLSYGGESSYVADVSRALYMLYIAKALHYRIYNVSGGVLYSIPEVIKIIKEKLPEAKISLSSSTQKQEPTGSSRGIGTLDLSRIRDDVGFIPEYTLEEQIDDFICWFKKHELKA